MAKRTNKLDDSVAWLYETVAALEKKLTPFLSVAIDKDGGTPLEQGASPLEDYFIAATERVDSTRRRLQNILERVVA